MLRSRSFRFVPVLAVGVYLSVGSLTRRWKKDAELEAPRSPHRRPHWDGLKGFKVKARARRVGWWFGDRVQVWDLDFGTRLELAVTVGWSMWLGGLCVVHTGDDYLHFTKRLGIIAASQLPFHYLLAVKSPYSPLQLLTRNSHETLNAYHQLLGRIVFFFFQLHAAFYLNYFVQKDLLPAKLRELYIICGIAGILGFTAIGTTALARVRRQNYRLFYITHVVLALMWMPFLFFHVEHIRVYLYETGAIYAINILMRSLYSKAVTGTVKLLPGTSLIEITIPFADQSSLRRWAPGRHSYLSLAGHPVSQTFRSNPFSIASIPSIDKELRFYARVLDGNTAQLARSSGTRQKLKIEGPYGISTHPDQLLQYDRVLFVAGGIGATFIVPLYRQLLTDLSPSKGSYRRQKVTFVWAARTIGDVTWALPEDIKEREGFVERLEVYITGISGSKVSGVAEDHFEDQMLYDGMEQGIELEEQKNLLAGGATNSHAREDDNIGLSSFKGRPDLRRVVDRTFSHSGTEKVAVLVCGPKSLSQSLRKEVARWVSGGRQVWFWEETFAL